MLLKHTTDMADAIPLSGEEGNLLDGQDGYFQDQDTRETRRNSEKIRGWDVFNLLPQEERDDTETSKLLEMSRKALKVASYVFSFVVVLCTAVIAKGALLLMTSLAHPGKRLSACPKHHSFSRGDINNREYELTVKVAEMAAWAWCLYFVLIIPDVFSFLRSIRICVFKSFTRPKRKTFFVEFIATTCHSVGLALLVFCIFPMLDVIQATMLSSCVCLVPGIIQLLSHSCKENYVPLKIVMDILALSAQLSGFLICIVQGFKIDMNQGRQWIIPFALLLVSVAWWENFVPSKSEYKWVKHLLDVKYDLKDSRYFLYVFLSIWKMILSLSVMLIWYKIQLRDNFNEIFTQFLDGFNSVSNILTRTKYIDGNTALVTSSGLSHMSQTINSNGMMPVYVLGCQVIACWLCYVTAKFACRTCIQGFGFALPLHLASPILLSLMVTVCDRHWKNVCVFKWFSPYVFWTCPQGNTASYHIDNYGSLWMLWLIWLFSQVWFTIHVWMPKSERLASTEKLFISPMYSSIILDQSLLLNRRRDDETGNDEVDSVKVPKSHTNFYKNIPESMADLTILESCAENSDYVTRIYACATMWHETKEEMIQLLKSLFRMDEDQCARRNAQKFIKVIDKDYYEFEAHIFFDDAFEEDDFEGDEGGMVVNDFVKLLIGAIDVAASNVHNCLIKLKPPRKVATPYGGRLIWRMPGGNSLIAHLKNKQKIRHKKRWSQVMYMYYLLGRGIMESEPVEAERKSIRAENTYILALDGDINFRPLAVQLLVDLMKKNKSLGAACGRIHPVGSGPMVWYQKFEYAIGHWLQKATEHMIGCVLCSPGCFSLFRAKALMDDNVMRKYTTMSEVAKDYVQYDQGEDRWLCTLLLQRGYRVEYCAASDAYTHCPEGFGEFYNQRRRWAPSTMANIMDLLSEYKNTVAVNDSISMPYIAYQLMLMIGSILGPGTIFLMLVGAMVAAFRIPNVEAFAANFVPIVLYIIICFFAKNDFQILIAQILSAAYALLMMAVLVGTAIQLVEDGIASPAAIFLIAMASSFIISAIFHPQEFFCLLHGCLYFLSVPSMYLFLILYSLINLNNVSWGTREVLKKKTKSEMEEQQQVVEMKKKKVMPDWLGNFGIGTNDADEDGGISCSLSNLCKCMLCTYPKDGEQKYQLMKLNDQLGSVGERLYSLETKIEEPRTMAFRRRSSVGQRRLSALPEEDEDEDSENEVFDVPDTPILEKEEFPYERIKRDDMSNPLWMEAKELRRSQVQCLDNDEIEFWNELIKTYLFPLEDNKEKQRKVSAELKDLRNKVVSAFLMCNSLFVLVVFLLQVNKDQLHIEWPIGAKYVITFVPNNNEVIVTKIPLRVDPIGIVFVSFFALILVIQFIGMLFHRLGTMTHILASEELYCCSGKMEDVSDTAFIEKNAVRIAREMQQLHGINGDDDVITENGGKGNNPGRRQTIQALNFRKKENKEKIMTLGAAFEKRFKSLSYEGIQSTPILSNLKQLAARRGTLKVLEERRDSFTAELRTRDHVSRITSEADGSAEMERLDAAFPTTNRRTVLHKQLSNSSSNEDKISVNS